VDILFKYDCFMLNLDNGGKLLYSNIYIIFFYFILDKCNGSLLNIPEDLRSDPAISWRSVLLVEETEVSGKKHRPAASH
jgi:hypothetical protein